MNLQRLMSQLAIDEGNRSKPYVDTVGKTTIGVGRNLTDRGVSSDEIELMLSNDIVIATSCARSLVPGFDHLDDVRQEVLTNMALNLGYTRLAGFRMFLAFVNSSEFGDAAHEMLQSKWATQVGARATRLSNAMRDGVFK